VTYTRKKSVGLKLGFRSGLEEKVAAQLWEADMEVKYESEKIEYFTPLTNHKYCPDFILPNGIIIETKGRFMLADRKKHILIQNQHPDLDIRFVFSRSRTPITKGSPTTYGDWCTTHNFQYADTLIPPAWLIAKGKKR
jgi:hypothetical protein